MNNNTDFYKWFETIASKLGNREISFRKILESPAPTIGGKGLLVHEYTSHVRAKLVFSHYQAALEWI